MADKKKSSDSTASLNKLIDVRSRYRSLLLQNPNYFGNVDQSQFKAVLPIKSNTTFEEIGSVGYQPQTERLEATIYIRQAGGYGGKLCGAGTREYVRFYASWDDGATWTDLGLSSVNVWDIPGTSPQRQLEYAVTRRPDFRRWPCFRPQIVLIRAILSWNVAPPANAPHHPPVWGEVHDTRILVEPRRYWLVKELFETAGFKIQPELAAILDEDAQIPVAAKAAAAGGLHLDDAAQDVPLARSAHAQLAALRDSPMLAAQLTATGAGGVQASGLDLNADDVAGLFGTGDGNTSYEELESIGYDPADDSLVGVIRVKQSLGYSGGPCSNGSLEHVTFWADLNSNGFFETCLGTASVRVYDVTIPKGGFEYAVHLPADLLRLRKPCQDGPSLVSIRAILSWTTAMPCGNPDATPTWGNRMETWVHVLPGPKVPEDELVPLLSSAGGIPVGDIDGNGYAQNAVAVTTGHYFNNAPFGGRINLAGKIINGSPATRYRVMIRKHNVGPFLPLNLEPNGFPQTVVTPGPTTTTTTVHVGGDGYYGYQDYSASHYVEGNILAVWQTSAGDHGNAYDLRVDIKDPGNPLVDIESNVVTVEVDNQAPVLNLEFTSLAGDCAHFGEKAVFQGKFSVTDPHFGGFSFQILPTGPAHGVLPTPPSGSSLYLPGGTIADPGVNTTFQLDTNGMDPCGYALVLHASDRTNVNSGGGHNQSFDSIGFCLGSPPEG